MDHKPLTRTTNNGNTAILVIVEAFSGFPHLIPVQDMTAETTARAIVHHIIPYWGIGFSLYSDKSPSFVYALFANINQLLGIRHVASAARTARSNGLAEAMVKRLSEHLKLYAKDDYSIEEVLPLIELNLRATPHSKLAISPYEIVFARPIRIGVPGDPITTPPLTPSNVTTDRITYYQWLSTESKRLHTALKQARVELKIEDKRLCDKYNKTVQPSWNVGDRVLLQGMQVRPGASKVISKQRYTGPYMIKNVVKGRPYVGIAYQLMDDSSGKILRNLVSNDRLKRYNENREKFNEKLPKINVTERDDANPRIQGVAKPLEIVREHRNKNKQQ